MEKPNKKIAVTNHHPKQDFQVERIAFFSDAVFAIAITLLVIEFRPPHFPKDVSVAELWQQLDEMKLKLIALVFSFVLVVKYWMRHHILFKYIHNYNKEIITANMIVLLPVIFFPFTTSFVYENTGHPADIVMVPIRLFMLNHILAGLSFYYFYWIITVRFKDFSYEMPKEEAASFKKNLLIMTIMFVVGFILTFLV